MKKIFVLMFLTGGLMAQENKQKTSLGPQRYDNVKIEEKKEEYNPADYRDDQTIVAEARCEEYNHYFRMQLTATYTNGWRTLQSYFTVFTGIRASFFVIDDVKILINKHEITDKLETTLTVDGYKILEQKDETLGIYKNGKKIVDLKKMGFMFLILNEDGTSFEYGKIRIKDKE